MRHLRVAVLLLAACGGSAAAPHDALERDAPSADAAACSTRITYGGAWIRPAGHPAQDDLVAADVTWDGTCTDDGGNSYAVLSNGFKPYFMGKSACEIALDHAASCASHAQCATRISYGAAWLPPPNHPAPYDDLEGRVFASGACTAAGADSREDLSNGFQPHFTGASSCELSVRWDDCGGLYGNPVIPTGCADPGVLAEGGRYYLSCTSGNAADAFPIYLSTDLVTWTAMGAILPVAAKPAWATGDFWAPEIHRVGSRYIAYFSARNTDGRLSIGAASASDPLGPYAALAHPLVHDPNMGLIDASELTDADGTAYLLWKEDGNAQGQQTPIHAQALAADGLSLTASPAATLITNDQAWEGAVTEGPWMIAHAGVYYLFYSGNSYANTTYALGVAKASSPLGPFTKHTGPIVASGGAWAGPGHCSVVSGSEDLYVVYHAWEAAHVNAAPGRLVLVDQIVWSGGWPTVPGAPSSATRPMP